MRKHHSALGGVALALALTLTGCSDDGTDPDATETLPPRHQQPTPTSALAHAEDRRGEGRSPAADLPRRPRRRVPRSGPSTSRRLNPVATGEEFLELQETVVDMTRANVTKTGEYVHTLGGARATAASSIVITDCEDRTGVTVKVKGKVRTPDYKEPDGNPLRNPVPVEVHARQGQGRMEGVRI